MRSARAGLVLIATVLTTALTLTGCSFNGLSSVPIPGAHGTGNGSYRITALLPDAAGLVTNAPVMIDDATVGSIGPIDIVDWHARVTLRLDAGTKVPAGSHVMIGMTSVLGSSHLEIVQPEHPSGEMMAAGSQIPLVRCPAQASIPAPTGTPEVADINAAQEIPACTYPTTEQVLSSLSVVLNGGGLAQVGDVVHELSSMFNGRQQAIRTLIPRLNTLVDDLNRQRGTIIAALSGLDRLAAQINAQTPTVERALAQGPQILRLLVDQRKPFTDALAAVGRLSKTGNDILTSSDDHITTILANLVPVLDQLQKTGPALTQSLGILLTFPFYEGAIPKIVKGDYVNADLVLDLSSGRLSRGLLSSVGLVGPEGVLGKPAGAAKRGLNPFRSPLESGTTPSPAPRPAQGGPR